MQEEMNKSVDHYVDVTVSDDKLYAFLEFVVVPDNFSCTAEQLEQLLHNKRIVHGIDYGKLKEIAENPSAFFFKKTLVAVGEGPVHGKNGYIQCIFDLDNDRKKPLELEDGKVDYKEITTLHNVSKGQLVARRILATQGGDGKTVTGETLPAKSGKEARFAVGKNVVLDSEQMNMYAAIDGMVTKTDKEKINVFPIYEVNGDVDYSVGNIDFVGSVVIRGNVLNGFKIKASGDIRITGGIEAAELEAGGSIHIGAGILGQGKGFVKAGKNVKSSFIQEGIVEAGEDVIVPLSIMHSTIRAGKNVICQGAKGLIVGGIVQAGEKVVARTIGNSMSTATVIEVGVKPELRNELLELRSQLKAQTDHLTKTEKALSLLDQLAALGQLSPDKAEMRVKLNHTKKQAMDEIHIIRERILEIEKMLEETERASVEVMSTIYSGSKIVIGRYTKFIKDTVMRVHFHLANGDIAMSSVL